MDKSVLKRERSPFLSCLKQHSHGFVMHKWRWMLITKERARSRNNFLTHISATGPLWQCAATSRIKFSPRHLTKRKKSCPSPSGENVRRSWFWRPQSFTTRVVHKVCNVREFYFFVSKVPRNFMTKLTKFGGYRYVYLRSKYHQFRQQDITRTLMSSYFFHTFHYRISLQNQILIHACPHVPIRQIYFVQQSYEP